MYSTDSFNKYLWNLCYLPHAVFSAGDIAKSGPQRSYILVLVQKLVQIITGI